MASGAPGGRNISARRNACSKLPPALSRRSMAKAQSGWAKPLSTFRTSSSVRRPKKTSRREPRPSPNSRTSTTEPSGSKPRMKSSDIFRRISIRRVSGSRRATISGTDNSSRPETSTLNRYASRICRSNSAFAGLLAGGRAHPPASTLRMASTTPRHTQCRRAWGTTSGLQARGLMAVVRAARREDTDAPRVESHVGDARYLIRLRVDDVHRAVGRGGQIDLRAIRRRRRGFQRQLSTDLQARDHAKGLHIEDVERRIAPTDDIGFTTAQREVDPGHFRAGVELSHDLLARRVDDGDGGVAVVGHEHPAAIW